MADVSDKRTSPWIAFIAGGVAVLVVVLIFFAWSSGERAANGVKLTLRDAPTLPGLPHVPDAPRLPDGPVPKPK